MHAMRSTMVVFLGVLVLAGCGSGTSSSPSATTSQGPGASPGGAPGANASPGAQPTLGGIPSFAIPSISGGGDVGGSYTLIVEGSSLAGTYVSENPSGGCFVNAGMLQLALEGTAAGPNGMNVFVSVNGALAKATAGTSEFVLSVAFGDVDQGGTVAGYPSTGGNDGNLKAEDRGESIAVEANGSAFAVSGTGSSETMKLRLTAECTTVGRF